MKNLIYVLTALLIVSLSCKSKDGQWENLVKKDLSNWDQLNGSARYEIKNGEIIGTTVANSPNSFLCSKEKYGDFILEFDTWFDPQMNSGVQFRSESKPDYRMEGFMATRLNLIHLKEHGQGVFMTRAGEAGYIPLIKILRDVKLLRIRSGTITGSKLREVLSGHGLMECHVLT